MTINTAPKPVRLADYAYDDMIRNPWARSAGNGPAQSAAHNNQRDYWIKTLHANGEHQEAAEFGEVYPPKSLAPSSSTLRIARTDMQENPWRHNRNEQRRFWIDQLTRAGNYDDAAVFGSEFPVGVPSDPAPAQIQLDEYGSVIEQDPAPAPVATDDDDLDEVIASYEKAREYYVDLDPHKGTYTINIHDPERRAAADKTGIEVERDAALAEVTRLQDQIKRLRDMIADLWDAAEPL